MKTKIGEQEIEGTPKEIAELLTVMKVRKITTGTEEEKVEYQEEREGDEDIRQPAYGRKMTRKPYIQGTEYKRKERNKTIWTKKEIEEMKEMEKRGLSIRQIATTLGRTTKAVRWRIWHTKAGITIDKERENRINNENRKHKQWKLAEDQTLRIMTMKNEGLGEIARTLGRSRASIASRQRVIGLC